MDVNIRFCYFFRREDEVQLECRYRTKEDGTLYTENKYPQVVEDLYEARRMILMIPNPQEREALLDFASILEYAIFDEGGSYFKNWLKLNRSALKEMLDLFFAERLNGTLTWAVKGKLEKIIA